MKIPILALILYFLYRPQKILFSRETIFYEHIMLKSICEPFFYNFLTFQNVFKKCFKYQVMHPGAKKSTTILSAFLVIHTIQLFIEIKNTTMQVLRERKSATPLHPRYSDAF